MTADLANHYRNRTVVVTGGRGYLASALIPLLEGMGAQVVAVSRRDRGRIRGTTTFTADVRRKASWREIVSRTDCIFHLAGNTSAGDAALDPAGSFESTVVPLMHLSAAAREARRRPRVVFASTATVYGLTDTRPIGEDADARPITTYDLHKLCAERHLEWASGQDIVDGVSLRLANVYGPSPALSSAADRGVLNRAAALAVQGDDLCVRGDGNYLRDYVYIDDVIRAMVMAGAQPLVRGRSFNVGSGRGVTISDAFRLVAERAARISGRRSLVRRVPWPDDSHPIERRQFTAKIDGMAEAFGWRPEVTFACGIDRLVDQAAVAVADHRDPGGSVPPAGSRHAVSAGGPIRLNLGCGGRPLAGFINVDRDSLDALRVRYPDRAFDDDLVVVDYDILKLPFPDDSVDEVRADALIEHLPFIDERRFFVEVARVLKPGAPLFLSTVDFEAAVRQWLAAKDDWRDFYRTDDEAIRSQHWFGTHSYAADNRWGYLTATLFGSQNGAGQFHTNCYSEAKLRAICGRMQFEVDAIERFRWQGDRDPMLALSARKRR